MLQRLGAIQFVRFLAGGLVTLVADFGSFTVLFNFGFPLFVASAVSLVAGFLVGFLMNKIWVFRAHGENAQKRTTMQATLYLGLFLFNIGFTYVFIFYAQSFGVSVYIAKIMTMLFIMIWNFLLYRKFIFAVKA